MAAEQPDVHKCRWPECACERKVCGQDPDDVSRLRAVLTELVALVRGECPSLLDEDSGLYALPSGS